ncbi:MAG TPA: hypothetical protein VMB71_14735 [Acetobacteraceae bacterium]|nr:hypothetical protein [Acetobacteraceae bacterium]
MSAYRVALPLLALAVVAPLAARAAARHVETIALPGGGIAEITYYGNVAPRLVIAPEAVPAPAAFVMQDPFAMMARMSAEMDREASQMLRQAAELAAQPMPGPGMLSPAMLTRVSDLPAGTSSTTTVFTYDNGKSCSQTFRSVSAGAGMRPTLTSQETGDCAATASTASAPVPRRESANGLLRPAVMYTPR